VPTERATAAVVAVARAQGVPADRPRVVRDLTNVLVHLEPAPIVARVPVTLARLRGREWFAQVLGLAQFLADAGAPVAPPADVTDPGPHAYDGLTVELWAFVEHDPGQFDPVAAGRSLHELHEALAAYPEWLPGFERLDEVGRLLDSLAPSELASAGDLAALREAHTRLSSEALPGGRPLHGDAHFRNILWSPDGPLWTDLENACAGPIEYDLAAAVWRGSEGTAEALAAYGSHDPAVIERVTPFLALLLAAWTIRVVERNQEAAAARAELRRRLDWVRDWLAASS
jgi:aminoglycoside phosphotransferase (APT) family kinase protein